MKRIIWIIILLSLSACRADRIDISQLSPSDRLLFTEAANREGVEVTIHGTPPDWVVEYDFNLERNGVIHAGYSEYKHSINGDYCYIRINPNKLSKCAVGGMDQYFIVISRHELKHCNGFEHNQYPQSVMYKNPPCWPVD